LLDEERGFCADASARAAHLKKAFIDLSLQLLWIEQGRQAEYDRLTASPRGSGLKISGVAVIAHEDDVATELAC
jgi:hypothetical protein